MSAEDVDSNSIQGTLLADDALIPMEASSKDYQEVIVHQDEDSTEDTESVEEEDEIDELLTSDLDGELVKFMFNFFDLDEDGLVGSEELTQVILILSLVLDISRN